MIPRRTLCSVLLLLLCLIASARAVEPITLGTITTVVGLVVSVLSFALTAIKFAIAYAIFILISVFIFINFAFPILKRVNIVGILRSWVDQSRTCQPLGPGSGQLGVLGNLAQQARPGPSLVT